MAFVLRFLDSVPWQAYSVVGWSGLMFSSTALETCSRESPEHAAAHERSSQRQQPPALSSERIASLKAHGYLVVDDVLDARCLELARADCAVLKAGGAFGPTDQHHAAIRSDHVHWVEEPDGTGSGAHLDAAAPDDGGLLCVLRKLRAQAFQLELSLFSDSGFDAANKRRLGMDLGVQRGGQLASYSAPSSDDGADGAQEAGDSEEAAVVRATGGARYAAHRDGVCFGSASPFEVLWSMLMPSIVMRETTCILYLTEPADWNQGETAGLGDKGQRLLDEDVDEASVNAPRVVASAEECRGGSLVLFLGADATDMSGETATSVVEILPVGGRLVIFDSRSVLHEVRPHTRRDVERLAMTCWIGGAHSCGGFVRHACAWWLGGQ